MNRILVIALLLLPAAVSAQTTPPASSPPALRPPPNPGVWTIHYKVEKAQQKNESEAESDTVGGDPVSRTPKIKQIEFAINGKIARSIATYTDGTTRTAFVFDSIGVQENPADPKDLVINDLSSPWMAGGDFLRRYPGLEWIKPKFYRGVVKLGETDCHYFAEDAPPPPPPTSGDAQDLMIPSADLFLGNRQAWISNDGHPLATKIGTETATYTYLPANEVPVIQIPEAFRAKATEFLNSLAPTNLR